MRLEEILAALGSGEGVLEDRMALGIQKVKAFLSCQGKIRVFVAGSYSMGHQASTVQILYSLVDFFGYAGEVEIVYEMDSTLYAEDEEEEAAYQETERKLRMLFLRLPAEGMPQITYRSRGGNDISISFKRLGQLTQADLLPFGFTGGADYPAEGFDLFPSPDIYCTFFLHLQPYYWAVLNEPARNFGRGVSRNRISNYRSRIEYGQYEYAKEDYLPSMDLDAEIDRFPYLVYREYCQRYHMSWEEYVQNLNANPTNPNHDKIPLLQALFQKKEQHGAILWPIYGLHRFCTLPSEVIMNCVVSALKMQNSLGESAKPIVMVMLNQYHANRWEQGLELIRKFVEYTQENADAWRHEMCDIIRFKYEGLNRINGVEHGFLDNLDGIAQELRETADDILQQGRVPLNNRFEVVDSRDALPDLENGHVYLLKLGGVPRDLFNYLLYHAGMPPLFEGQGTSSFAMNLGKAYFQASLVPDLNIEGNDGEEDIEDCEIGTFNQRNYPSLQIFQGVAGIEEAQEQVLIRCNGMALAVVRSIKDYCEHDYGYNAETTNVAQFMWETYVGNRGAAFEYFQCVRDELQKDENEKLTQALLYTMYCVGMYGTEHMVVDPETVNRPQVANQRQGAEPEPGHMTLEQIDQTLQNQMEGREIDILTAFPDTELARYGEKIFENGLLLADCEKVVRETEGGRTVKVVLEDGVYRDRSGGKNHVSLTFTYQDSSMTVLTRILVKGDGDIALPGIPWIGLSDVGFYAEIAEAGPVYRSGLAARLKGTDLEISVGYPFVDQVWLVRGSFQEPQTALSAFYKVAGGVNFLQEMPDVLRNVGGFGLKDVVLQYRQKEKSLDYIRFTLETEKAWKIVENPCFEIKPQVDVVIYHVESLEKRQVQFVITGEFTIKNGRGKEDALVEVRGQYPDFRLDAHLRRGKIDLNDFVQMFGGTVDLKAQISVLNIVIDPGKKEYSLQTKVDADWKIGELFTVKNLGFSVESKASALSLGFSGRMVILPGKLDMVLSLSANYVEDQGWHFLGEQRGNGILQAGRLLAEYLGWKIESVNLPVLGLGFSMETATKAWEFSAKTEKPWSVPFIKDMSFKGSLKVGKRVKEKAKTGEKANGEGRAEVADLVSYGRMEADILWQNVAITLWYDYDPKGSSFGITWGVLEARVTCREEKGEKEWIAEVALKESVTLGSMIETMISWVKGSGFGLEAPWDILNSISLPKFKLIYNFTRKQIGFSVEIGEIDLGFAKITGIQVSYVSGKENPEDNGVLVSLEGEFLWNVAGDCGDDHTLGPWDASEPGSAPVPSGQGNKYFDLRMLAMGQHVAVEGISEVRNISQAIEKIGTMTEPEPGKLPPVKYDAASGWLVGMDFGVLKLTGEGENGYMLGMQAVWNDPNLYGMHFFLKGQAAKIFKGLEFEIMYKRLSDTLGVYQGEITLPDAMRHLELGAFSITLPVFAMAVYTNGDFQVDFGFPWGNDFTRSFALEAVIAPGIPITGAAGFYFGKLSSETTDKVPACSNGTFRPVLVFGVGIQAGIGKSLRWGILEAGFSLTLTVILEGVIAKWNPYIEERARGDERQISDSYFYSIDGKAGLIGKFYGTIDFAIIKASLNLKVEVYFYLIYANYQTISIMVGVSASVSLKVQINLGLFKISISLHFSFDLNTSFQIQQKGTAPWRQQNQLAGGNDLAGGAVAAHARGAIKNYRAVDCTPERGPEFFAGISPRYLRQSEERTELKGYLTAALTAAGDEWGETGAKPYYVPMLFMDGRVSFPALCRAVAGWMIALAHGQDIGRAGLEDVYISEEQLEYVKTYVLVSREGRPMPLALEEIDRFVREHFTFSVACPDNDRDEEVKEAVFFPMVPTLSLWVETEGGVGMSYRFRDYNALGEEKLNALREYFDQLAVQTEKEQEKESLSARVAVEEERFYSMASYIYGDYFLLLARNMVQAMVEALRDYRYLLKKGQTMGELLEWINTYRGSSSVFGGEEPLSAYTLYDIFLANQSHVLNHLEEDGSQKKIAASGMVEIQEGDTLEKIMARWDISLEDIALEETCREFNSQIGDLFDSKENPYITLPYLSQFHGEMVLEQVMEGETVKNLGGMVSRYHLHGLRMDTEGIKPRAKGVWVKEEEGGYKLPREAGLFALAGQQVAVPENYRAGFSIHLEREEGEDWLSFVQNGAPSSRGSIVIENGISREKGRDIARIEALEQYLREHILQPKIEDQGQRDMYGEWGVTYPFGGCTDCILQGEMPLPYGSAQEGNRQMRIWNFSEPLLEKLSSGKRKYDPVFSVKAGHYDYTSRSMKERDFVHFGGATLVRVAVKKVTAGENPSCFGYEILGMGAADTDMLAKVLSQSRSWEAFCMETYLGYACKELSGKQKIQFDAFDQVSYFMAQSNLSTVTRPGDGECLGDVGKGEDIKVGGKGSSQEFVRLLWEACITNQGGFYLFYDYGEGSDKRGLPEEIFNEKGEAELVFAILYQREEAPVGQIVLHDYMNVLFSDEGADSSREVFYVQSEQRKERVILGMGEERESLRSLCDAYDTDVCHLLEDNPGMLLRKGLDLLISGGVYMADGSGREPGCGLADIAKYFHTTLEELKEANSQKTRWGEELAPFEAIHLPDRVITVEEDATLEGLAEIYGIEPEGIAVQNMDLAGIFQGEGETELSLTCGSRVKHVLSPAGVLGMSFVTERLAGMDSQEGDGSGDVQMNGGGGACDMSPEELLLGNYTLLAYRILENADYSGSGMGLPAGPRNEGEGQWKYQMDIPYTRFLREKRVFAEALEPVADHPYGGIGTLLQMEYQCNDLYGNQMASTLTDAGKKPVAAGYTDALVSLSAWPSMATWWRLQDQNGQGAEFVLGIGFQASCYAPDDREGSEDVGWYERAVRDLGVYETLYFQLLDGNGVCYETHVSVLCDKKGETYAYLWDDRRKNMLDEWLLYGQKSVYRYLRSVADTRGDREQYRLHCQSLQPAPRVEIGISLDEMLAEGGILNQEAIYPLQYEFTIRRQNGRVMGDFENVPGIRSVCSQIAPVMEAEGEGNAGQSSGVKSLAAFAQAFEAAMRGREGCLYKIAQGRNRLQGGKADSLWVVKQGQGAGAGIYFDFGQEQEGKVLGPPPLSNHLEGRAMPVAIPGYKQEEARSLSFSGIDLDRWLRVVLHSVENVLSPEMLYLLRRLDDTMNTTYYDRMLDVKRRLAAVLSNRLTEVFAETQATQEEKRVAREALYQGLLVSLEEYYNVQGAILLNAQVAVPDVQGDSGSPEQRGGSGESPRLLGQMVPEMSPGGTNISISQTKISLRNESGQPLACLVNAPEIVRDKAGAILPELNMYLSFRDIGLEHQIGSISGIEGYQDSSWLKWVVPEDSLFWKPAAQVEMPVLIRNFPDTPKLEEQICACHEVEEQGSAGIHWDYLASYTRPYHYPQDEIHCHIGFNRQGNDCLWAEEGIFEAMARFVTLREEVEEDLKILVAKGQLKDDGPAAMYLALAEGVAAAFEGEAGKGQKMDFRERDGASFSYDFVIQEGSLLMENVNALTIAVAGSPLEGMCLPEVLVASEGYHLELVPEDLLEGSEREDLLGLVQEAQDQEDRGGAMANVYCYRHLESGELLSAAQGQQVAKRTIKVGNLHLLRHQSVDFSMQICRNGGRGLERRMRDCFIYRTGDIGFGTVLYPSAAIDQELDMTSYGGMVSERVTVTEHLQSFFQRLLPEGDRPDITVQLETEYQGFVNENVGYVSVPIFFQLPLDSGQVSVDAMVQAWGGRIEEWYHKKINDVEGTWRKGDRLSFHLLFLSNETEEPMPLLQIKNVILPCQWIVPGE